MHKIDENLRVKRTVAEETSKLREIGYWHRNKRTINYDLVQVKPVNIIQDQRVKEIVHQFNSSTIHPPNMTVNINNKTFKAHPQNSIGSPVYQGVRDSEVKQYFMEIAGVDRLPTPQIMKGKFDINESPVKVWVVKPTTGPLEGYTVFSSSQHLTNAKFTIEIVKPRTSKNTGNFNPNVIKSDKVEIKF